MIANRTYFVLVASFAMIVTTEVAAADFRVLDFGASCDNVASLEAARGAMPYEGTPPSSYQFAFRAHEMDHDVIVGYSCKDGKFIRGAYIVNANDGDEATQIYTAIKRRITKEIGAPSYDFASAEYRRKMKEFGAQLSRSDMQVSFWNTKRAEVHASVAEPSRNGGWRVSLSYTAIDALGSR